MDYDELEQQKATNRETKWEGIQEMKAMNQDYLNSGKGSLAVREFLTKSGEDDELLLLYLKGRKYRPKHAWETLKRKAEVRFDAYPEIFPPTIPDAALPLLDNHIMGVLKGRDRKGRRIIFFNANEWDTEKYSLELMTTMTAFCADRCLTDEDSINNGVVFIQECSNMGMRHIRLYTLSGMIRFVNIFWNAYPVPFKGAYYMNTPQFFIYPYKLISPFLPKKLKDRFVITSRSKKFEVLHQHFSPDILPKFLGGKLESHEAVDHDLFNFH